MTQKEAKLWLKLKYPVTVVKDRYGGCYSGGRWVAFPLDTSEIPKEVMGEDIECGEFWDLNEEPVGIGHWAEDAVDDLEYLIGKIAKGVTKDGWKFDGDTEEEITGNETR